MTEPTTGRSAQRGRTPARERTLSVQQGRIIEATVLRAPARDLARLLDPFRDPDAVDWDEADGDAEETEEDAGTEGTDTPDLEAWEADADGDATENDGLPVLDDVVDDVAELEGSPAVPDQKPGAPSEDVMVLPVGEGEDAFLQPISGLAGHLLALSRRDGVTSAYHVALRQRIAATLAISARIVAEYGADGLEQPSENAGRLRRDEVRAALGLTETQMSGLLAGATLRTPGGRTAAMRLFFAPYSAEEDTDEVLLRLLAERAADDQHSPFSDAALAELVGDELTHRGRPPIKRAALRVARAVRLGLPDARERKRRYAAGETPVGMAASGSGGRDCLLKWRRLLDRHGTHRNATTRTTVREWLAELDARLNPAG